MTLIAVYTRPDLALLATDTYSVTRRAVSGRAVPDWPLLATGSGQKLEWCAAGWFAGSGVGPWLRALTPVLRALSTFAEAPRVLQEEGERLMRAWEVNRPELAAHVRAERLHWFLVSAAGPTAQVLNWRGTAPFTVRHGQAAGCGPPAVDPPTRQLLLTEYSRELRTADMHAAVRATARYLRAMGAACGPAGGVSDYLEMGLLMASPSTWRPYYLPRTHWQDVARGAARATLVGSEGPDRTIVRREPGVASWSA